jgi:anti-sigma regulatory factor (Ser/Thr protein kinase)
MQPRGAFPGTDTGAAERARAGRHTPFGHTALLYSSASEYAQSVGGFALAGLDAGEPVMIAVPGRHADLIKNSLGPKAGQVAFGDMAKLGRNPARIIEVIDAFAAAHDGQPVRYVGEPVWPSRTDAEKAEAMRHEALLNVAFGGSVQILCPYDVSRLTPQLIAAAEVTHPVLMRNRSLAQSPAFAGARVADDRPPLPDPPAGIQVLAYRDDPAAARRFVRGQAVGVGLREPALTDLVIAVGELAANTLRHTSGPGSVRVWTQPGEVICEVRDTGHIKDVLAGRRRPPRDASGGHGLRVVNQVCDLVEMRTGPAGTAFRLHMGL